MYKNQGSFALVMYKSRGKDFCEAAI